MKLSQVRKCDNCGGPLLANRGITFYVVRVTTAIVSPVAYQQTAGLAAMFGGSLGLAEAMSPEPDVIKVLGDKEPALMTELLICMDCYAMKRLHLGELAEKRNVALAEKRNAAEDGDQP